MGSPLLSVASLAVDIAIGTITSDYGVKSLSAVATLVALAMPFAPLGQHLLSSEN